MHSPTPARPSERVSAPRLSVLVVDDDASARAVLASAVENLGHRCRTAEDGAVALELQAEEPADVILSDWHMPRMDGFDLCRHIRAGSEPPTATSRRHPYTYFFFVTAHGDKAHFLEGMHAGADDYLTKPVDLEELEVRLEAAKRVVSLYRGLEARNERLRRDSVRSFRAARTDALTTMSNRLRLNEDLAALQSRAARYGHSYVAALCDIDRFKAYNDHFGHLSGDEVLRKVALTIRRELRRGDSFYRYGGEEFLAILPEQTLEEAAIVMDRVRRAVEELGITHAPDAKQPVVTISVGLAEMSAESADGTTGWIERADAALYDAKAAGRNRVVKSAEQRMSTMPPSAYPSRKSTQAS